jgi:hypothetical protein
MPAVNNLPNQSITSEPQHLASLAAMVDPRVDVRALQAVYVGGGHGVFLFALAFRGTDAANTATGIIQASHPDDPESSKLWRAGDTIIWLTADPGGMNCFPVVKSAVDAAVRR